jgi:hypothetical protein
MKTCVRDQLKEKKKKVNEMKNEKKIKRRKRS